MELKDPVSLKMTFIFNAGDPWSRVFDFEKDLADFLARRDFVGEMVNNINGQSGEMIVFVRQRTMEEKAMPNKPVQAPTAATQIKKLQENIK